MLCIGVGCGKFITGKYTYSFYCDECRYKNFKMKITSGMKHLGDVKKLHEVVLKKCETETCTALIRSNGHARHCKPCSADRKDERSRVYARRK